MSRDKLLLIFFCHFLAKYGKIVVGEWSCKHTYLTGVERKLESDYQRRPDQSMPQDLAAVRTLVVAFLKKCQPNMLRLRDKEALKALITQFTSPNMLAGAPRDVKNTGMVRKVDDLGRLVVPAELRRSLGIRTDDALEIFFDPDEKRVVLQRYELKKCHFCDSQHNVNKFKDKYICEQCVSELFDTVEVV